MTNDVTNPIRVLLIENDEMARNIFMKCLLMEFSSILLDVAINPECAEKMWKYKPYDIVVCDAILATDVRLNFIKKMCINNKSLFLLIAGDTELTQTKLNQDRCVIDIIYKPINLSELISKISSAMDEVLTRRVTDNVTHI